MASVLLNRLKTPLHLIIRSKERTVFQGDVYAITSYNDKGPFDILAGHENFISVAYSKLLLYKIDGTTQQIPLNYGIIKVLRDQVEIYLVESHGSKPPEIPGKKK